MAMFCAHDAAHIRVFSQMDIVTDAFVEGTLHFGGGFLTLLAEGDGEERWELQWEWG